MCLQNSYVEFLTLSTSECQLVWRQGLYGGNQVKMRSFRVGPSLVAQLVKNPPAMQEPLVKFLGWEDLLEKG